MNGVKTRLVIYLIQFPSLCVSAPLAEPSPDTHLAALKNLELKKHRLSYRNPLCIKETCVGVAVGIEPCSARRHLVNDKIQTGLWGDVNHC